MKAFSEISNKEFREYHNLLKNMLFDDETMGQTHTQMGCYASAAERLFDWIEDNL